jgi:hypothetical protein
MAVAYHYTIGYFTRRDLEARKNVLSEGFSPLPELVHLNRLTNPFGGTHIYKVGRQIVCGDRSLVPWVLKTMAMTPQGQLKMMGHRQRR